MQRAIIINQWSLTIVMIILSLGMGCSIHPVQLAIVNGNRLQDRADISLIKPNDGLSSIEDIDNGNWNNGGQINKDAKQENPCRVKYHPSYSRNHTMVVEGEMAGGKKYPVILDTGASPALFVNDVHIIENKLAIYPFKANRRKSAGWGICHLPKLRIGKITLIDWPCFYREQHTELQFFGLSVAKDKAIIVGLPALRRFKYIVFDSINKEVEFSLNDTYEPANLDLWDKYPFVIEEGLGGNAFLFVKFPIAGEEIELQLDTGSGKGLAISQQLWEQIQKKIQNVKLRQAKELYPYIGLLDCEHANIPELQIGNKTVKNTKVSIFPDYSPLLDRCQGLLGMQYFRDTLMVLDFQRNLMWVKNAKTG